MPQSQHAHTEFSIRLSFVTVTRRNSRHRCRRNRVLALDMGLDWIIHIDGDELFYGVPSVSDFFDCVPYSVWQISFRNFEGVPETWEVANYFREVTLFKRDDHLLRPVSERISAGPISRQFSVGLRQRQVSGAHCFRVASQRRASVFFDTGLTARTNVTVWGK